MSNFSYDAPNLLDYRAEHDRLRITPSICIRIFQLFGQHGLTIFDGRLKFFPYAIMPQTYSPSFIIISDDMFDIFGTSTSSIISLDAVPESNWMIFLGKEDDLWGLFKWLEKNIVYANGIVFAYLHRFTIIWYPDPFLLF